MHRAFRPATRALGRRALNPSGRRFASTSPVDAPRSWKSSFVRWGLAGGAVYYYSTSSAFAQEPSQLTEAPRHFSDSDLPTVDSIVEEKRQQIKTKLDEKNVVRESQEPTQPTTQTSQQPLQDGAQAAAVEGSPEALEQEAGQQGAFNPETGEINWDCPCLGGMADGPCGENFKAAFSCFVYSDAEPKGMDCIDKFQAMQDCFREHPDVYGDELRDDAEAERQADETLAAAAAGHETESQALREDINKEAPNVTDDKSGGEPDKQLLRDEVPHPAELAKKDPKPETASAGSEVIPTAWDDATAANDEVKREEIKTPGEVQEEQKKEKKQQQQ